jgi:acetyl-CoA acetyltransferase
MRDVVVIGVGMHPFGRHMDKSLTDLGQVAIWDAIRDAVITAKDIQVAYFGNSVGGLITGQEGVRGQTVLAPNGIRGIPVVNVENACASGTTAFRGVWLEIASGLCDVGLALGVEKLFCGDTARSAAALAADSEIALAELGFSFTSSYAMELKEYMDKYHITQRQFAKVVEKNSYNGSLNPYAQYQQPRTVDEVLNSKMIAWPLTLYMCAPMSDGAAAAILCSKEVARKYTSKPLIKIAACEMISGIYRPPNDTNPSLPTIAAERAYKKAGIGPGDVNVAEVHDAMAPAELHYYEELGFCKPGEGGRMIDERRTWIDGDIAVNPSGGLTAKGHPVGATGLAQISEIVWQLRGEAGKRQVKKRDIGLTQNSGGWVDGDPATTTVTILKRISD